MCIFAMLTPVRSRTTKKQERRKSRSQWNPPSHFHFSPALFLIPRHLFLPAFSRHWVVRAQVEDKQGKEPTGMIKKDQFLGVRVSGGNIYRAWDWFRPLVSVHWDLSASVQWEYMKSRLAIHIHVERAPHACRSMHACVHACVHVCVCLCVCVCKEEARDAEDMKKAQNSTFKEDVLIQECPLQRILVQNQRQMHPFSQRCCQETCQILVLFIQRRAKAQLTGSSGLLNRNSNQNGIV